MKSARLLSLLLALFAFHYSHAQNFELMTGTKRLFFDFKYIKIIEARPNVSLLHRTRANAEYDAQPADLFTGTYLNYSLKGGIGPSLAGRISSAGSGFDVGVHYFKASRKFFVYTLPSVQIKDEFFFSWLTFLRFSPMLNEEWVLNTSLELFTAFNSERHLKSLQRVRLGTGKKGFLLGLAIDFVETGDSLEKVDANPGVFVQKQF
jgi:hypothetical protein